MKKILTGILIFVTACSTEQAVKNFPRVENIKMNEIVLSEPLYSLGSMFTTDDHLVIYQRSMPEMYFSCYSLDDLHFVLGGGQQGQGPDDFNRPSSTFFIPKGNGFTAIDYPFFRHIEIEGEQLKVVEKDTIKTPMGLPPNNYSKIDDNVYCITNIDQNRSHEFILFDKEGEHPVWKSPYPKWANVKELPFITYGSFVVANPDLKRFIVFYGYFRRVRMFDSKGDLLKDISVEFPFKFPPYEEDFESKMSAYNSIPYADNNYIYVICHNSKVSEKKETTELQIWNWNAEPVAVLYLDKRLRQFTISQEKRRLYAIDPLNDEDEVSSKIFWCDLPDWL